MMDMSDVYDVIVIGAGHNGLAAAALLGRRGRRVLVLERRDVVGGLSVGDEFHPGYRSAGLLHDVSGLPGELIDALKLEGHGLVLEEGPAAVFAPQIDGRGLLLRHDPADAFEEIAAHSKHDAESYGRYRAFVDRVGGFVRRLLMDGPPDVAADGFAGLADLLSRGIALRRLGRADMLELMRIVPMCVADWLGEWFESDVIRCVLAQPAIAGSFTGPWSPGTSAVLLRNESLAGRCVRGGAAAVIDALAAAARSHGVQIRTSAQVERIRVADGRVVGVTLAGGENVDAPVVASSCDAKRTFLQLMGADDVSAEFAGRIEAFRSRGVTAKVDLALNGPLRFGCRPELEVVHARIGETVDDLERAFDAVKYGRWSEAPMLDVYVPTVEHGDWAREGHSVVSVLAHYAPYELNGGWTDASGKRLGDAVVESLSRYAPDLIGCIVARRVLTPADIERRYGVTGGHLHHGELGLDQMLVRPCPEASRYATPIGGLYLCGGSSFPGGGVLGVCGWGAAGRVVKDEGRNS